MSDDRVERLEAPVLQVQRLSTEDGPGLRTTVFFKGCPLACRWCQNPESIAAGPELTWDRGRCIGCGACVDACPNRARTLAPDGVHVDPLRCVVCGGCAEACPTRATERLGERRGVDDLFAELLRDRAFYGDPGGNGAGGRGGVTLSGGEPTAWPRFALALLERCRAAGIHTALDTCGQCREETLRALAERADLVLYDLKEIDPERHERFTGRPNSRILANAQLVAALVRASRGAQRLWIRTPLIPRATANERTLRAVGAFIAERLGDAVERWELCAFNPLCESKYRQLGRAWDWAGTPLLTTAEVAALADVARASGVPPAIVWATGPTRAAGEGTA